MYMYIYINADPLRKLHRTLARWRWFKFKGSAGVWAAAALPKNPFNNISFFRKRPHRYPTTIELLYNIDSDHEQWSGNTVDLCKKKNERRERKRWRRHHQQHESSVYGRELAALPHEYIQRVSSIHFSIHYLFYPLAPSRSLNSHSTARCSALLCVFPTTTTYDRRLSCRLMMMVRTKRENFLHKTQRHETEWRRRVAVALTFHWEFFWISKLEKKYAKDCKERRKKNRFRKA